MTIGIIGAGKMARAFARQLVNTGYNVIMCNSRGPHSLSSVVTDLGSNVRAATTEEVAKAKIVMLAVHWDQLPKALANLPPWEGRIVIDATNPNFSLESAAHAIEVGERTSSERVAELVPGARLVKAFNTLYYKILEKYPEHEHGKRVVFLSGDDQYAKKEFSEVVKRIGFAPVDLGNLASGGRMQQFGGPLGSLNLLHLQHAI